MTAAHLPPDSPTSHVVPRLPAELSLDIRQRLQDQQVDKLKQTGTPKKLSPMDAMGMLRYTSPENPTTWEYKYRALFLEEFPETKASVEKFQTSPGCGCRRMLQTVITLKHAKVTEILEKVYEAKIYEVDNTTVEAPKTVPRHTHGPSALIGQTAIIDPTATAYSAYMKTVARAGVRPYTGVSVMPTKDAQGVDKWMLLFW